jgi:hypothetical protein
MGIKRVDTRARSTLQVQTCSKLSYMATGLSSACVRQIKRRTVMHLCKVSEKSGESNNEKGETQ